jgi:hypothetical protein
MNVDLTPLGSVEETEVWIPSGIQEILIAADYKSAGRTWTDADITEFLRFRHKCILAGDLNAKHPSLNISICNHSGRKLLQLFNRNDFEISSPQYRSHYSLKGNGDILDIVVHKNVRLSDVIVSDNLDSDHWPIIFHILDHVRKKQTSTPLEKFTDWERLQSLASNLVWARVEINPGVGANKAARAFTASIASVYGLSTSKIFCQN